MTALDLEKELVCIAQALRPVGKLAESVLQIAYELGAVVWLRVHTSRNARSAQIDLASEPAKIILYRHGHVDGERWIRAWEDDLLTRRERFSIAHELGHWIAFTKFNIGPQRNRRKYWEQERAINSFAGSLMAPDWLVVEWLREVPSDTPVSPFALRRWAISQSRCSEEVVAKALTRQRDSIGFLKLLCTRRKDGTQILKVLCSASGKRLNLPQDQSHISDARLQELLSSKKAGDASVRQLRLGKCDPQDFRIAWRRGTSHAPGEVIWVAFASITDAAETRVSHDSTNGSSPMQRILPGF